VGEHGRVGDDLTALAVAGDRLDRDDADGLAPFRPGALEVRVDRLRFELEVAERDLGDLVESMRAIVSTSSSGVRPIQEMIS
jgi:hypothetical protein